MDLPADLLASLETDFFIRFTTTGRRSGAPRTTETTFVWDGDARLFVSGYPGRRDWIANIAADGRVVVHTVENARYYDIPCTARVVSNRDERTPLLLAFLEHWAVRPQAPRKLFRLVIGAIRLNRRLHLPWWGPFYFARRILDRMPCAELTFAAAPQRRTSPPPSPAHPM